MSRPFGKFKGELSLLYSDRQLISSQKIQVGCVRDSNDKGMYPSQSGTGLPDAGDSFASFSFKNDTCGENI